MAISDWKRVNTQNDEYTIVEYVYKYGYDKNNIKRLSVEYLPGKISYKYELYAMGLHTSSAVESFKTRPKALKRLHNYMRSSHLKFFKATQSEVSRYNKRTIKISYNRYGTELPPITNKGDYVWVINNKTKVKKLGKVI